MAGVVDAGYDKAPVALFDHGDRGVLDSERKQAMVRTPDDAMHHTVKSYAHPSVLAISGIIASTLLHFVLEMDELRVNVLDGKESMYIVRYTSD